MKAFPKGMIRNENKASPHPLFHALGSGDALQGRLERP